ESYYVIFLEKNESKIAKYIDVILSNTDGKCCKTKLLKSEIISLDSNDLFQWVISKDTLLHSDQILPFIYLDTSRGLSSYKPSSSMHTFPFKVDVSLGNQFPMTITFNHEDLNKYLLPPDTFLNLNYLHNKNTSIFELYYRLDEILTKCNGIFIFKE